MIIELETSEQSAAAGRPLREVKLPRGTLICAIVHDGEMRVAHGDDIIEPGDTVIAITVKRAAKDLKAKFL